MKIKSEEIADKIIDFLLARKGFDEWWEGGAYPIEDDVKTEIKEGIAKIIEENA